MPSFSSTPGTHPVSKALAEIVGLIQALAGL